MLQSGEFSVAEDVVLGECEAVQVHARLVDQNPAAAPCYTGTVLVGIQERCTVGTICLNSMTALCWGY